jgi:GntR family transcriptional regulator
VVAKQKSPQAAVTAMVPKIRTASLSDQTTKALLDAILERRFPDDRLPSEPELADMLNVSRTTLRAALQSLERLGMVSRAPGRGTVIRTHVGRESIILQRLIGFRAMLQATHEKVESIGRYWRDPHPDADAMVALRLTSDTPVVATSKTFLADDKPALHIEDQIPFSYVSQATQEALAAGEEFEFDDSIFAFSQTWPGRTIDHVVVEMVPMVIPGSPEFPLDLAPGTPYVMLLETHYTEHGEAVAFSRVHVDDRYIRFHVVRHN